MLNVNVNGGNVSDNEQRKIPHTRVVMVVVHSLEN
jgi:hypothetical protein